MKRGRSTTTPTKEEAEWIVAVKEGPCVACLIVTGKQFSGCDAHHLLSGGRRIGHLATIGLCQWHHRGIAEFFSHAHLRECLGPSLMDGSKLFREAYGTDEELMAIQKRLLGKEE